MNTHHGTNKDIMTELTIKVIHDEKRALRVSNGGKGCGDVDYWCDDLAIVIPANDIGETPNYIGKPDIGIIEIVDSRKDFDYGCVDVADNVLRELCERMLKVNGKKADTNGSEFISLEHINNGIFRFSARFYYAGDPGDNDKDIVCSGTGMFSEVHFNNESDDETSNAFLVFEKSIEDVKETNE
jgi:hypothetical protein